MKLSVFALIPMMVSTINGFNIYSNVSTNPKLDQKEFLKFLEDAANDHTIMRQDSIFQLESSVEDLQRHSAKLSKDLDATKEWPALQRLKSLEREAELATEYYIDQPKLTP